RAGVKGRKMIQKGQYTWGSPARPMVLSNMSLGSSLGVNNHYPAAVRANWPQLFPGLTLVPGTWSPHVGHALSSGQSAQAAGGVVIHEETMRTPVHRFNTGGYVAVYSPGGWTQPWANGDSFRAVFTGPARYVYVLH